PSSQAEPLFEPQRLAATLHTTNCLLRTKCFVFSRHWIVHKTALMFPLYILQIIIQTYYEISYLLKNAYEAFRKSYNGCIS
uniref:Uncharacterized protein n=1 Tax=Petromyzon marinus TaxID=7757 RepID=S4RKT9_PETMA